ncbi:IS5 family transposase [Nonomuraea sp. NPDC001023]|uniref:IS5 family transposase n=1 Tax=unclassified Nonomuraea TaxID=2593643 RepID=UPI00332F9426
MTGGRGRPWRGHRQVIDGLRTGAPWRDVPERYGPGRPVTSGSPAGSRTVCGRGCWRRRRSRTTPSARSSSPSASTPPSPAPTSTPPAPVERHDGETIDTRQSPIRQALGRSRGGLTTKLHLLVKARGLPLVFHLTGGNVVDRTAFPDVMARLRIRRSRAGRPHTRPDILIGDKGYSSRAIRLGMRRRGIKTVIPERRDQIANRKRKGSRGARPHAFDELAYKHRNLVEHCIGKLRQWRAIATRFDKPASSYLAGVTISSLMLWLRQAESSDTLQCGKRTASPGSVGTCFRTSFDSELAQRG